MTALTDLTLIEAGTSLRAREISALQLTEAYLDRISRLNPKLDAFITVAPGEARLAAQEADAALRRGDAAGLLHGIPIALKDLFETAGLRTTAGSKILADYVPAQDAEVVRRLRAAGAIVIGKTNMHEWAYGLTTENPHWGRAKNPWDLARITGGSSGGSGAAVAARLAPGSLGSDTGGSIRIPAALCGVTGLKPTYGRVSLRGVIPLSWSNDHAGPMARTAADTAVLLNVIAGYDAGDPASVDRTTVDYAKSRADLRGVRFAAPGGYWARGVEPEVLSAVAGAVHTLERLGAERIDADFTDVEETFAINRIILGAEAAAYHRQNLETRAADFGPDVLRRLQNGSQVTANDYVMARRKQVDFRRRFELFFAGVDLLVTPTSRIVASEAGTADPVRIAEHLTAFTAPFNVTGLPALSLPCGFGAAGLPIGLQLVTRPWNEILLLQAGALYQSETDWHMRAPPI